MAKNKSLAKSAEGVASISPSHSPEMEEHETNMHLDTITKAMDIMNDKSKMDKVHKLVGRKKKAITSLTQLRDIANKKALGKDEEIE